MATAPAELVHDPAGIVRPRLFKDRPGKYLVEDFLAHVRTTGQPETFPGIHPGPLDKTEPFLKLAPFGVPRPKRPRGDMVPCPMCHQANKYLSGALVYLPRLQAIAAIGHECSDSDTRLAADREYRARRDREQEEDYLLANVPVIPARLAMLKELQPVAREALGIYRAFRKKAPSVQRQLRDIRQRGARLIVTETIEGDLASVGPSGFRGGGGIQTRDVGFGVLAGATAVISDYNPLSELARIVAMLRRHDQGSREEATLDYAASLNDAERRRAVIELREADRAFYKFRDRLDDFCAFFSPDNIERISAWASHPEHPAPFLIRHSTVDGVAVVLIKTRDEHFVARPGVATARPAVSWPMPEVEP